MSKYCVVYNEISKKMNKIELIYLGKVNAKHYSRKLREAKICEENSWLIGPYVHSKFLTSAYTAQMRSALPHNKMCHHFQEECIFKESFFISNMSEINNFPVYNRFIMNAAGEIYTTPTGYVYLNYYYICYLEHNVFLNNNFIERSQSNFLFTNTVYVDHFDFSKIVGLFTIKKKYRLPGPVFNLILLELCKIHFKNSAKYMCRHCHMALQKNLLCVECDSCYFCKCITEKLLVCHYCSEKFCHNDCYMIEKKITCGTCADECIF